MAAPRYNRLVAGVPQNVAASETSAPEVIVATNPAGYIDQSFMPPGVGQDTTQAYPTESIAAGAPVNTYQGTINSAAALCVRNADSGTANATKACNGFAPTALTASTTQTSTIYRTGPAAGQSGLTPGLIYFLGPAGTYVLGTASTVSAPSSGTTVQQVGIALSATVIDLQPQTAYAII